MPGEYLRNILQFLNRIAEKLLEFHREVSIVIVMIDATFFHGLDFAKP